MDLSKLSRQDKIALIDKLKAQKSSAQNSGDDIIPQGEIPASVRAKLSFASNPDEERGLLEKEFPGAKLGKYDSEDVITLPGEKAPKYIRAPGIWNANDVASLAGDIPSMAGGVAGGLLTAATGGIGAAAVGAGTAAGEAARKLIGRGLLGVPTGQDLTQDAKDVALQGVLGGALQYGAGKLFPTKAATSVAPEGKSIGSKISESLTTTPESDALAEALKKSGINEASEFAPQLDAIKRAKKVLPDMKYPPMSAHENALSSPAKKDTFDKILYGNSPVSENLQKYHGKMTEEIGDVINDTAKKFAPNIGKTNAGQKVVDSFVEGYEGLRSELGKGFEAIKDVPVDPTVMSKTILSNISENPVLGPILALDNETGRITLKPWSPKLGNIDKAPYEKLRDAVDALNTPNTVKEVQRIREYLRGAVDPLNPGAYRALNEFRKVSLDSLGDAIGDNPGVKNLFKQYALNEQRKELLEEVLGKSVDSAQGLRNVAPEKVLDRIFQNTQTVKAVGEILGEDKLKESAGYMLQKLIQESKDPTTGVIRTGNLLRSMYGPNGKIEMLEMALPKQEMAKIKAALDIAKLIPSAPASNPSKTSYTLLNSLMSPLETGKNVIKDVQNNRALSKGFSELQTGKKSAPSALNTVGLISKGAKIADKTKAVPAIGGGMMSKKYQDKK